MSNNSDQYPTHDGLAKWRISPKITKYKTELLCRRNVKWKENSITPCNMYGSHVRLGFVNSSFCLPDLAQECIISTPLFPPHAICIWFQFVELQNTIANFAQKSTYAPCRRLSGITLYIHTFYTPTTVVDYSLENRAKCPNWFTIAFTNWLHVTFALRTVGAICLMCKNVFHINKSQQ